MKKLVKLLIAISVLVGIAVFALQVKVQLVEPTTAVCDPSSGIGC